MGVKKLHLEYFRDLWGEQENVDIEDVAVGSH